MASFLFLWSVLTALLLIELWHLRFIWKRSDKSYNQLLKASFSRCLSFRLATWVNPAGLCGPDRPGEPFNGVVLDLSHTCCAPRKTHLPIKEQYCSAQSEILLKFKLTPLLFLCLDELSGEDTGSPGSHWARLWTDLLFASAFPNIASGHKIQGGPWAVYASLRCFRQNSPVRLISRS